jgi:peptide/nickel transport system permease protein
MAADVTNGIVLAPEALGVRVRKMVRKLRRMPLVPTVILSIIVFCGITAPWISPHDPTNGDLSDRVLPPFWQGAKYLPKTVVDKVAIGQRYREVKIGGRDFEEAKALEEAEAVKKGVPVRNIGVGDLLLVKVRDAGTSEFLLGTDQLGRDILSRLFHGARISLIVAAITLGVGGTLGTFLGLLSGYFGGWVDEVIMRLVDVVLSIPLLLITLVLVAALGSSFQLICAVLSLLIWPLFARVTRGEVLQLKSMDYVALARVTGASSLRIMLYHLFPGVLNTLIIIATLNVGVVILVEASLSFLGAGIPPPTPAWGSMVADGRDHLADGWWVSTMPGLAIMFTVVSLNLFGDWLRDTLDPRLRQLN